MEIEDTKLKVLLDGLRSSYLQIIDNFFEKHPNEAFETPVASLIGTIMQLLYMLDINEKFEKDIHKLSDLMTNRTFELTKKIKLYNKRKETH